jgi:hypothetical protein
VIVDLSQAGFDFIMFDSDVFLSPTNHPLSFMNDFANTSWDIQFQLDETNELNGHINIGWFWARPSILTVQYFIRSKQKWEREGGWDQAIMNKVLTEVENLSTVDKSARVLSIRRLDIRKFLNFMLTDWFRILSPQTDDQKNFYTLDANSRYEAIANASKQPVIWHYTCVEKTLKLFFGKYFGQWTNLDGYYTDKRRFLTPINLGQGSKNTKVLLRQFLIAVKVAIISGRTLIFPDTAVRWPINKFPAVRIFSIYEIEKIGIEYVEPTFLHNRKTKHGIDISSTFTFNFSTGNNQTVVNLLAGLLEKFELSLKEKELVILDFAQFDTFTQLLAIENFDEWWKKHMVINKGLNININSIRLCRNINAKNAGCLGICT